MRIKTETVKVTVYYFDKYEKEALIDLGVWNLLINSLKPFERIEVDE